MAIERGCLQNLIFDQANWNHRALALVLKGIIEIPPLKRALADKQIKSRYLENLIAHQ